MWEILKSFRTKSRNSDSELISSPQAQRVRSAAVNFKDLNITADADDDDDEGGTGVLGATPSSQDSSPRHKSLKRLERNRLIIIMVGLPGRGKTFLCNKLVCYLNWLGHHTRLFNVGSYRRVQKEKADVQDAAFFDKENKAGLVARQRALEAALADLTAYLSSDTGQVAIFDATNTTDERRSFLVSQFHGKYQYLFIESICTDEKILEQNYRYKMKYSPDYRGVDEEQALRDFKQRVGKYEEVYEPITDRTRHYIKLIDMVTGRGHMDINRISGYIPGKIVFFLMQVCKAGMAQERKIWLTRHGLSVFNKEGRIGGDSDLSPAGWDYAAALPDVLLQRLPMTSDDQPIPVSVWTSTLKRTIQTARGLPFPALRWKALDEIHAGSCDGLTYSEIAAQFPGEYLARSQDKLRYRYPAGESYLDVIQRLEPVVIEMEREKECVMVVAHQAVLRAIYGYFIAADLKDIPNLEIPLHTLIELKPRPDGTMQVELVQMPPPGTPHPPNLLLHAALTAGLAEGDGGGTTCSSLHMAASPAKAPQPGQQLHRSSMSGVNVQEPHHVRKGQVPFGATAPTPQPGHCNQESDSPPSPPADPQFLLAATTPSPLSPSHPATPTPSMVVPLPSIPHLSFTMEHPQGLEAAGADQGHSGPLPSRVDLQPRGGGAQGVGKGRGQLQRGMESVSEGRSLGTASISGGGGEGPGQRMMQHYLLNAASRHQVIDSMDITPCMSVASNDVGGESPGFETPESRSWGGAPPGSTPAPAPAPVTTSDPAPAPAPAPQPAPVPEPGT